MATVDAARARSNDASQPLLIPPLYQALHQAADSIRTQKRVAQGAPLDVPLAIQGDRSMRYDLLARVMQTARLAGFKNLSLQVTRTESAAPGAAGTAQ
jgi:biopolymer transport protein ExbD